MSFHKLKVDELREVAKSLGVLEDNQNTNEMTKKEIIVELEDNGVTWSYYQNLVRSNEQGDQPSSEDEDQAIKKFTEDSVVLLKMIGQNASIQVLGYNFTLSNPFNFMNPDEAQQIIDFYPEKFRLAHPKEAKEFYN
jgi:hypothetical protein